MKHLFEVFEITNKETDYIVYLKNTKKVVYYGGDSNKAESTFKKIHQSGKRVDILRPMKKITWTKEQIQAFENAPSMYSGI